MNDDTAVQALIEHLIHRSYSYNHQKNERQELESALHDFDAIIDCTPMLIHHNGWPSFTNTNINGEITDIVNPAKSQQSLRVTIQCKSSSVYEAWHTLHGSPGVYTKHITQTVNEQHVKHQIQRSFIDKLSNTEATIRIYTKYDDSFLLKTKNERLIKLLKTKLCELYYSGIVSTSYSYYRYDVERIDACKKLFEELLPQVSDITAAECYAKQNDNKYWSANLIPAIIEAGHYVDFYKAKELGILWKAPRTPSVAPFNFCYSAVYDMKFLGLYPMKMFTENHEELLKELRKTHSIESDVIFKSMSGSAAYIMDALQTTYIPLAKLRVRMVSQEHIKSAFDASEANNNEEK